MKNINSYVSKVYDISSWDGQLYTNTLGTRKKMVYQRPDGRNYFFKESYKNYPWEFWSEIIASKIGQLIGARVADYNVAYYNNEEEGYNAGCISEYVQDARFEELIHGIDLLITEKPEFDKVKGKDHSFQLIEIVLNKYPFFKHFIDNIIEAIVFDALIGNRDRHQENWAIIMDISWIKKFSRYPKFIRLPLGIINYFYRIIRRSKFTNEPSALLGFRFSPLYDNGSSLGREILECNLDDFLTGPDHDKKLRKYALGKMYQSHIRWEGEHVGHFELIRKIRGIHPNMVKKYLLKFVNDFDPELVEKVITNVDKNFETIDINYCLSNKRKQLIIALLKLRHLELKRLLETQ